MLKTLFSGRAIYILCNQDQISICKFEKIEFSVVSRGIAQKQFNEFTKNNKFRDIGKTIWTTLCFFPFKMSPNTIFIIIIAKLKKISPEETLDIQEIKVQYSRLSNIFMTTVSIAELLIHKKV